MTSKTKEEGPKIVIREWNVVAHWDTSSSDNVFCFICRNKLNGPSLEYEVTFFRSTNVLFLVSRLNFTLTHIFIQQNPCDKNAMGLQILHGQCGHAFHADCVQRWCRISTDAACARCGDPWTVVKNDALSP